MTTQIIQVHNLVKRYKNADSNAVDGVSFGVAQGEFFALLGPNGAGKTTTISILTTTLAPTSGSVEISGYDLGKNAAAVRSSLGIIFQKPSLDLNLTAEENVRFHAVLYGLYPFRPAYRLMPRAYREQVEELSAVLGIGGDLFRPVKTYSGGDEAEAGDSPKPDPQSPSPLPGRTNHRPRPPEPPRSVRVPPQGAPGE